MTEGGSRKFWEVTCAGSDVTVRFGRIGTSGTKAGVYPTSTSEPTVFPEGFNTSVFADGHAKAQTWKAMHGKSVDGPGGSKYVAYAAPEVQ